MQSLIGILGILLAQGHYWVRIHHAFVGKPDAHEVPTIALRDNEGYLFIGGYTFAFREDLPDGWLTCLTPAGKVLWTITPGGLGPDRIYDLALRDSILYFCGSSGSALSHPEELPVERRSDFWVGAVERSTGRLLWQHRWGSPFIDVAFTLCPTPYRTLLVGGFSWEDTVLGMQATLFVLSEKDGEILFQSRWGKTPSLIRKIRPFAGMTFICIGEQEYRPVLAEIDYMGQIYWRTAYQVHRFPSQLSCARASLSGQILVAGQYNQRWGITAFNAKGQALWEHTWSEPSLYGSVQDLIETADGTILAVGWQEGEKLTLPEQRGGRDIWLAALSREGKFLWERGLGGPHDEKGVALLMTGDTLFLIAEKENRFTEDPPHKDAWLVLFKAIPCAEIPVQIKTDVPSLKEKAGRPIRFWIEVPPAYVVDRVIWDFGDDSTAEGPSVEHTFGVPGSYSIQARVDFRYGCKEVYLPPVGLRITRP